MNELRFVLVPKRLTDEQFWSIYFALTRARLPKEAFDTSLQAPAEPRKTAAAEQVTSSCDSVYDGCCILWRSQVCRLSLFDCGR